MSESAERKIKLDAFRQKKFVITAIFIVKMKSCKMVFRKGDCSIFHRECHSVATKKILPQKTSVLPRLFCFALKMPLLIN